MKENTKNQREFFIILLYDNTDMADIEPSGLYKRKLEIIHICLADARVINDANKSERKTCAAV